MVTTTTIYLLLIEISVLIGAVAAWLIHRSHMNPGMNLSMDLGGKNSHKKHHQTLNELENRELVPWGWPNHQSKSPPRSRKLEASEAMVALMECIMMEKRLITEGDLGSFDGVNPGSHHLNSPRTDNVGVTANAVQGNASAASAESNGETVDIVDVFGRSANVLKYGHLGQAASEQSMFRKHSSDLNYRNFEKKEILRPWGW